MKTFNCIKKKINLIFLFVFILLSLCISSCKKDIFKSENLVGNEIDQKDIEQFFLLPKNAPSLLENIVKDIKKTNSITVFLKDFIQENGIPNWNQTITNSSDFESSNVISTSVAKDIDLPMAIIPLISKNSKEVTSVIFCIQRSDSVFNYTVFNKEKILSSKPKNKKELTNGIVQLGFFAGFENRIYKKNKTFFSYPYGYKFENIDISFVRNKKEKASLTASAIGLIQKRNSTPCEEIKSATILLWNIMQLDIVYAYNSCTNTYHIISIGGPGAALFYSLLPPGDGGGNSSGSSQGLPGGDAGSGGTNFTYSLGGVSSGHGDPVNSNWGSGGIADPFRNLVSTVTNQGLVTPAELANYPESIQPLISDLSLNILEANWLTDNLSFADELREDLDYEDNADNTLEDAKDAAKMVIASSAYNMIDGPFDEIYYNSIIAPVLPLYRTFYSEFAPFYWMVRYQQSVQLHKATLKIEHPTWSNFRLNYNAYKGTIQSGLEVIGMAPYPVGNVFNFLNGSLYSLHGDFSNASFSFLGAVSTGWAAASIKAAIKSGNLFIVASNNTIRFSRDQGKFRRALGLTKGDGMIAHHVIGFAKQIQEHSVIQLAAQAGFHINDPLSNGVAVAVFRHAGGGHPNYTQRVISALNQIQLRYVANNQILTSNLAMLEVQALVANIFSKINAYPNTPIDDLIF